MFVSEFIIKSIYAFQAIFIKTDTSCPFCSSLNFEVIFKKAKIIDICHCRDCELYWTNPIFTLKGLYNFFYKTQGLVTKLDKNSISILLSSNFKNSEKDYHEIINWLKSISPGKKLLEFGSSWGYFLYQAKYHGFECTGIEISNRRAKFGKDFLGVNIVTDINALVNRGEKFDIIFSANTLEHIGYEIRNIFNKFYNLLTEGGIVVIEAPYLNFMKGKEAFKLMGAIHPLCFNKEFFIKNLSKHNFETKVYYGYRNVIKDYKDKGDSLIIVGIKIKNY